MLGNTMLFLSNLMIYYIISDLLTDISSVETNPLYIHFLNCEHNILPALVKDKKDVGIVIQKQYENLSINYAYMEVTLFFDGTPYKVVINLSTITSIEIFGKIKMDFEYRLSREYLISLNDISHEDYMNAMKVMVDKISSFDKGMIQKLILQQKSTGSDKKVGNLLVIEDILKK